jgi:hypothetical protein
MQTLENITRPGSKETVYLVLVDGIKRGIISKFRNDRHTTNPWKAFRMGCLGSTHPNHMHGCWYGANGKKQAIEAIVDDSVNQPLFTVYPPKDKNVQANWHSLGIGN